MLVYVFVFSMVLLIIFPSFVVAMVGWDGLGLSSLLLILYYNNRERWVSGYKAYVTNRIGDGLLVLVIGGRCMFGNWDLVESGIISLLFVLGASTKRAQFPFVNWLPAAMAAPTPVSCLVHSSTLVTAGIYILIRYNVFFWYSELLLVLGLLTLFWGALMGLLD